MKKTEIAPKKGFEIADLMKIVSLIRKNWWITVVLGGLGYGIGYMYVFKTEKVYACSTQLLLKQNSEFNQSSLINDGTGGFYGNVGRTFIDNSNEMRILKSQDLIEEALQRLDFDVSYFLVGRVRTTEVYTGVPFRIHPLVVNPGLYEQMISMKILSFDEYRMEYQLNGQKETVTGRFNEELLTPKIRLLVERGPSFIDSSAVGADNGNYLIQMHRISDVAKMCLSRLTVNNPQYTNVLELSYQDVIPERGNRFLDTLSQVYIENTLQSRIDINKNTLYYIDRQMEEVSGILNDIEDSLEVYRRDNQVIDLDRQADLYFDKYSAFDDQKRTVELQQMALNDLEQYIIEDKDPSFLPPTAYLLPNDNFQEDVVDDLYRKQRTLNQLEQTATPNNFDIIQIRNQIDSTKRDILVYINNSRTALKQKTDNIDKEIGYYDSQLGLLPMKQRGLLNIMRLQRVNQDMYVFLLERKANTIIGRASIVSLTQVIERPRLSGIVSPNENKILIAGLSVGLILAALIIFIRIFFFNKIETYDELKSSTTLPVLGEVALGDQINELVLAVEHSPRSPVAESFRTIRTNLQYMLTGGGCQVIVVTSNRPGEGKTFCSLNIAASLAKGGRKVILLELDLHKPRVQKGLGINSEIGISTIAIGKSTVDEAIIQTSVENLYTILAGILPPNPSELVTSKIMTSIIDTCKQKFDYVVIDTPPVGLITDAIVLMRHADVTLFVLNTKFPSRASLANAHDIAQMEPSPHFGFILNGVKRKRSRYYYNRYGYGYGYGYGGGYGGYGYGGGYGGGYGTSPKSGFFGRSGKGKSDQK